MRLVQHLHELRLVQPCGMKMIDITSGPYRAGGGVRLILPTKHLGVLRLVLLQVHTSLVGSLIIPVSGPVSVYIPGL